MRSLDLRSVVAYTKCISACVRSGLESNGCGSKLNHQATGLIHPFARVPILGTCFWPTGQMACLSFYLLRLLREIHGRPPANMTLFAGHLHPPILLLRELFRISFCMPSWTCACPKFCVVCSLKSWFLHTCQAPHNRVAHKANCKGKRSFVTRIPPAPPKET